MRFLLLFCTLSVLIAADLPRLRPPEWAQPVMSKELGNWYKLDELVYRAEQPDDDAIEDLKAMGIKRVLNLRNYHDDDDLAGEGLELYRVEMDAGSISEDQIIVALKTILSSRDPIIVHCWHGSDRTGTICAAYRVLVQGWSKEEAIDELINGGYGYHSLYGNIPTLIRSMDVEALRARLQSGRPTQP